MQVWTNFVATEYWHKVQKDSLRESAFYVNIASSRSKKRLYTNQQKK